MGASLPIQRFPNLALRIPLTTGEVLCVSASSGAVFWKRQVSATHYAPYKQNYSDSVLRVSADQAVCIARAGACHFVALDRSTGETILTRTLSRSTRRAEQMDLPSCLLHIEGRDTLHVAHTPLQNPPFTFSKRRHTLCRSTRADRGVARRRRQRNLAAQRDSKAR